MELTTDEYFERMKALSPWTVRVEEKKEGAADQIREFTKGNHLMKEVIGRLLKELATFPPNADHFKNPGRSMDNGELWYTVTEGHFSFELKIEYRYWEKVCWVVEAKLIKK